MLPTRPRSPSGGTFVITPVPSPPLESMRDLGRLVRQVAPLLLALMLQERLPIEDPAGTTTGVVEREAAWRDYRIVSWQYVESDEPDDKRGDRAIEIFRGQERVLFEVDWNRYTVHGEIGTDMTGDGRPDLVLTRDSRGNHGYIERLIFELEPAFLQIGQTPVRCYGWAGEFQDMDSDGVPEYLCGDGYCYWRSAGCEALGVPIILRWSAGRYVFPQDLMRIDAPDGEAFTAVGQETELWREMLRLTYGGRAEAAWRLLAREWCAEWGDRDEARRDFLEQLRGHEYWDDLLEMNGEALTASPW